LYLTRINYFAGGLMIFAMAPGPAPWADNRDGAESSAQISTSSTTSALADSTQS